MNIFYLISKFIKRMHIPAIKNSNIHKKAKICSGSHLVNVNIKRYSYIGSFCTIVNTDIGEFCSIADNCIIGGANHPIDWVSTSPAFHKGKNIIRKNFSLHIFNPFSQTTIGNDVWIGNNCLIKSGVTIADGAVIGMGAVVTKNVGPYEIWAGNQAKLIRKRFDEKTIEKLLENKWWQYNDRILKEKAKYFNDPQMYLKNMDANFQSINDTQF